MGCRSFLQGWTDEKGNDVSEGRMNLGVVTLNLPRIALESGGDESKFWSILAERVTTVGDALLFRIERCKEATPENAPILYIYGAFGQHLAAGQPVDTLFRNKRSTVSLGYIGLYEVAAAFYGGDWETNSEVKDFTVAVLRTLQERAKKLSVEYGYQFSVYATPSESLTDRFCRLDTEKFGFVPNITDKDYCTNSFHYDVRKSPTPFEKLDFEKVYPSYSGGGFIHYCEYPILQQNPKALEAVWDYSYDRVGYLGTNTPIDRCYACGFSGDFDATERGFECPECPECPECRPHDLRCRQTNLRLPRQPPGPPDGARPAQRDHLPGQAHARHHRHSGHGCRRPGCVIPSPVSGCRRS